jgi:hypothetical protein
MRALASKKSKRIEGRGVEACAMSFGCGRVRRGAAEECEEACRRGREGLAATVHDAQGAHEIAHYKSYGHE